MLDARTARSLIDAARSQHSIIFVRWQSLFARNNRRSFLRYSRFPSLRCAQESFVVAHCNTMIMLLTYLYIALICMITLVAVGIMIWFVIQHRPQYSPAVVLRNLRNEQLLYRNLNEVYENDAQKGNRPTKLSVDEMNSIISLIRTLQKNSKRLAAVVKLALYSCIVMIALTAAIFAPNAFAARLAIATAALICACVFVFAGALPIVRIVRNNTALSKQFEDWAAHHPEYCVSARNNNNPQQPWS